MLNNFFNKFFKSTQKIFEVLAVYNLIAAVLDLFFGYYDWMIMYFSGIKVFDEIKNK